MTSALIENLASALGVSGPDAEKALESALARIRHALATSGEASVPGVGAFRREGGSTVFLPTEGLQLAVNHRYEGLTPVAAPVVQTDPPPEDLSRPESSDPIDSAVEPDAETSSSEVDLSGENDLYAATLDDLVAEDEEDEGLGGDVGDEGDEGFERDEKDEKDERDERDERDEGFEEDEEDEALMPPPVSVQEEGEISEEDDFIDSLDDLEIHEPEDEIEEDELDDDQPEEDLEEADLDDDELDRELDELIDGVWMQGDNDDEDDHPLGPTPPEIIEEADFAVVEPAAFPPPPPEPDPDEQPPPPPATEPGPEPESEPAPVAAERRRPFGRLVAVIILIAIAAAAYLLLSPLPSEPEVAAVEEPAPEPIAEDLEPDLPELEPDPAPVIPTGPLFAAEPVDPAQGGFSFALSESSQATAEQLAERYRQAGYRVTVQAAEVRGMQVHRILLGQFDSTDEAEAHRGDLPDDVPPDIWILRL